MGFFFWDWTVLLLIPALILGLWAQAKVSSSFKKYSKVRSRQGYTGAQVARYLLDGAGLNDVAIERVGGRLSDHYDPRARVLRLSDGVYASPSLAAIGVAAHETGHALQHSEGYLPLGVRNAVFPVARIGSWAFMPTFLLGLFFHSQMGILLDVGIMLFTFYVFFTVVTLPVEFNASRRALQMLTQTGYLSDEEVGGARSVLSAAAMTYVAGALMAILNFLRLLILRDR
ncbi:MAG: zinc metallopeptidase [Candidatus Alcyoniella australis]|nr:zinc metallopeptidase [Candidatus Alcyoniella australis]